MRLPVTIDHLSTNSTVAVIILAAGTSSRMGSNGFHKLLANFDDIPLVRRTALAATGCQSRSVVVVTGHRDAEIRDAIARLDVQIVYNDAYLSGMASSLAAGVNAAERSLPDGVLVLLADMPFLTVSDLDMLITEFQNQGGNVIVRATANGARGNPVIFPRQFFGRLKKLTGDEGARRMIGQDGVEVVDVEIGDAARIDVDTPDQIVAAGGVLVDGEARVKGE